MKSGLAMRRVRRSAWVVASSVALHLLALWLLPSRPITPLRSESQSSVVEFESAAPAHPSPDSTREPSLHAEAPPAAATARLSRPLLERAAAPARPPSATSAESPPAEFQPSSEAEPPPEVAAAPAQPESAPPAKLDLTPRSAALSTVPLAVAPAPATDDLAARRGAELSASLRAEASVEADRLRQLRKLELRRDPDGTCHYSGTAIDATIRPDGGVEFADKGRKLDLRPGAAEPPERPVTLEDTQAPQRLEFGVRLEARAWEAERAWFLRETQAIRRELADAAHARELRASERGLVVELERIWCDASKPKPARRRAIFELWAETSSDEIGARGRAVILDYVRRNLPAGTPDAFSRAELMAFAALPASGQRFEPYATPPPDAGR